MIEQTKLALLSCIALILMAMNAHSAMNVETSLLKTNQSYRSNLSSQPNIDKGEVSMPVQVSIIYIIEQPLPDFISQLAARNNFQLSLSDKVSGTLKKISLPMEPELILPELSKTFGLQWHMKNKHLFVSTSLENENRLVELKDMSLATLKKAMHKAGLNPGANKMKYLEEKNAITLIGSRSYIVQIEAIVKANHNTQNSN